LGGAQIVACIVPRASSMRWCPSRESSSRTRAPGSTVTVPMLATAIVASPDCVSSHAPTRSVELPLAVVTCQPVAERRIVSASTSPATTSVRLAAISSALRPNPPPAGGCFRSSSRGGGVACANTSSACSSRSISGSASPLLSQR
jgi:hypothetical protein